MKYKPVCVVSKPFDIDQVLIYLDQEKIKISDVLWIIIKQEDVQSHKSKKYLSNIGIKTPKILMSPLLIDYFVQIRFIDSFFINYEQTILNTSQLIFSNEDKDTKKFQNNNKYNIKYILYSFLHFIGKNIAKFFIYIFSKLFWIYSYNYYKKNIDLAEYNLIVTQIFPNKMLLLSLKKFDKVVLYSGGRHSQITKEKTFVNSNKLTEYLSSVLSDKRAFGISRKIKKSILQNVPSSYEYISYQGNESLFLERRNILFKKNINNYKVLIVGSFEKIDKKYILFLKKNILSKYPNNINFKDLSVIYRPHPRQKLKIKEEDILINNNFTIVHSNISLDIDLLDFEELPSIMYLGASSSNATLKTILPHTIKII